MLQNQQYDTTSLMGFQMSILCLEAALELAVPVGSKEVARETRAEAEQLKSLIESNQL